MIVLPTTTEMSTVVDQQQLYTQQHKSNLLSDQSFIFSCLNMSPNRNSSLIISPTVNFPHQEGQEFKQLSDCIKQRQRMLIRLSNFLGSQQSKTNINNKLLAQICQVLNEIRHKSLEIAQKIITINRQCMINQGCSSLQCKKLLLELSSEINLLRGSFLNRFIMFQQDYDPFFLYHYEMKDKKSVIFHHPAVDKLFNLNISYASRLIKAKKSIESLLSETYNQTKTFKRKSKSLVPEKKINFIPNQKIQSDARRTRSNFKIKNRLINKINEANKLNTPYTSENSQKNEKDSKFNPSTNEDQHFTDQAAPIKFRNHTILPKTHFLKSLKKKAPTQNQKPPHSINKQSFNFKQKLIPLTTEKQAQYQQQMSNSSWLKYELQSPIRQQSKVKYSQKRLQNQEQKLDLKSTKDSQKQQLKMRSKKLTLPQLQQYIMSLNITQQIKNQAFTRQAQLFFSQNQSYLSQFFINKQLKAIGISSVFPKGGYFIRVWAPLVSCSPQMNKHIFCKYIDYLQKLTQCDVIYYNGSFKQLVLSLQFIAKNDTFMRNRLLPKLQKQHQFAQFLSFKCSNILFPQQNQSINMLYSDQIQSFTQDNYYIQQSLAQINKDKINPNILLAAKISKDITDMKALNSLLQDQQFDTYEVTSAMKITNISAIRIAQNLQFKSFIAGQGYFKFDGQEIFRKDDSLICKIQTAQHNCFILLGKGFSNIDSFVKKCDSKTKKACQFSVKMFNKQLYGRMINNSINLCCYANWEFSLSWKDQIQGRIKHNMTVCETFGSQSFYFGIQIQSELIFCFQVKDSDHLY